jgi:prepilin-type N-terminal cleavage/methylation domain-containing protein
MTKILKARKSGFTLVELLIVIMIIAILAGMMMLATGAATDGAEATKVINDLRSIKGATMLFFLDEGAWPDEALQITAQTAYPAAHALAVSFDRYTDRPLLGGAAPRYAAFNLASGELTAGGATTVRAFVGLTLVNNTAKPGVRQKIEGSAQNSGVYGTPQGTNTPVYNAIATGNEIVWMVMH